MANVNKKSIVAMMLVYGIARGVIDNVKPDRGDEEAVATDTTVFNETVSALTSKETEVNNGK